MAIPKFDRKELTVASEIPGFFGGPPTPVYNFPVKPKEAYIALYKRQPIWQITALEQKFFIPRINPDNVARAFVFDGSGMAMGEGGGKDMFGIEWEYIAQVGGSMVRPGKPLLEDANEWHDKLVWPDIDAWDWEGAVKENEQYLSSDNLIVCVLMNGWYERLISFMDFEGAAMAMIDEDQTDAVKELFDKLSDLYIRIIDKYLKYFPQIGVFNIHDDWGSQRETFFSPAVAAEMIVPYMRKVTDHLHSIGKFCEFHSCGHLTKQIPNMIAAGWDLWNGQAMNDTRMIYEQYGDKIIIGVNHNLTDPDSLSEDELRAAARDYADKFCKPDKPSILNFGSSMRVPDAFREELYIRSRENYSR